MIALLVSPNANADADSFELDSQLHLRFGVGVVAGGSIGDGEKNSLSFTGPGVLDGVQLGGNIGNDISFFVEADSLILVADNQGAQDETTLYGFLLGAGMGTHLFPADIYVSAAAGVSINNVEITGDGVDVNSQAVGFGISLMAGKDWSVTNHWNVGIGGQVLYLMNYGIGGEALSSNVIATGFLLTASFK